MSDHDYRATGAHAAREPTQRFPVQDRAVPAPAGSRRPRPYPIADDLLLIMLDDRTGHLSVDDRLAGLGLAAALLVELTVGEWVYVQNETLHTYRTDVPPLDIVRHTIVDEIDREPNFLRVRDWLDYLALTAVDRVSSRLERATVIVRQQRPRRLFRGEELLLLPTDKNTAAWPRTRLSMSIRQPHHYPLSANDLLLAGLCDGSGVLHSVLDGAGELYEGVIANFRAYMQTTAPQLLALVDELERASRADAGRLA